MRSLFNNLPGHATTILIGDSLQKGLVKKDLDRNTDCVRIRSVGGLCVVATVQALLQHKPTHPLIKKVVFTLGINDHMHRGSHCHDEIHRYYKGLQVEASRVFPNATLHFVIPYKGMADRSVKDFAPSDLLKLLKANCPNIRCHIPPSLTGKVNDGGIHPSGAGNTVLTKWYSSTFVPPSPRVFNRNSGRKSQGRTYSRAHIQPAAPTIDPAATNHQAPAHQQAKSLHPLSQQQCPPDHNSRGLASEIVSAFTQMMSMWGQQPTQPHRYQTQQWPPIRLY